MLRHLLLAALLLSSPLSRAADAADLVKQAQIAAAASDHARAGTLYAQVVAQDRKAWNAAYNGACAFALAGQPERAFPLLVAALDAGFLDIAHMAEDGDLVRLHGDPRWKPLLEQAAKRRAQFDILFRSKALATPYHPALSIDEKMAGLALLWSEVKYNALSEAALKRVDWDAVLLAWSPKVRASTDSADYYRVLREMLWQVEETELQILLPEALGDTAMGAPPFRTRLLEGRAIVDDVIDEALHARGVRVGVEVASIDGQDAVPAMQALRDAFWARRVPHVDLALSAELLMLRGPAGSTAKVGFVAADGSRFELPVTRIRRSAYRARIPKDDAARLHKLPDGVLHFVVNQLDSEALGMLTDAYAQLQAAPALIIDLRRTGQADDEGIFRLTRLLMDKPFELTARVGRQNRTYDRLLDSNSDMHTSSARIVQPDPVFAYRKPVFVLTSGRTEGCIRLLTTLQAYKRATLVGERSGTGINGLRVPLPGGAVAWIGALAMKAPDGGLSLSGVEPDLPVQPRLADFRQGIDTVLQAALAAARARQ